MISLFIDTCTSNLTIAIIKNNQILSSFSQKIDTDMSAKFFPVMQDIFNKAEISPKDVDLIYVVNGPGSFTGIRIGVTIAKTYAWTLNKKIIPISSLEVMASTKVSEEYIVPVIDARRDYVYAGIYDEHLDIIMQDNYISIESLKEKLKNKSHKFISYDSLDSIEIGKPEIDFIKIINKHKNEQGINPHKNKS